MPKLGVLARGEGSRDGPKVSGSGSVEPIACLVRRRPRRIRSASRGRARARERAAVRRPTSPPWRMSKRGLSSKRTVLRSGSRRPVTSQRGSSASARRFRCRSRCMQERERTRPVCEPALTVSPLIATFHARRHASRCRRERRRGDLSAPSETPALVAATRTRTRASVHPGPALPTGPALCRDARVPFYQIVLQFALLIQLEQTPDSFTLARMEPKRIVCAHRFHPLFLGLPLPPPAY